MRTFTFWDREFQYAPSLGERTVEVPLALEVLKGWDTKRTVEVGAVLHHNAHVVPAVKHRVIDRFETNASELHIEQVDACAVDYTGWNVLSISTLEHFDVADHANPDVGGSKGPECLEKIIREAREYFITLPLGYNPAMDRYVRQCGHPLHFLLQKDGPTNQAPDTLPVWVRVGEPSDADWATPYGRPFHYANALVVLTNVPWITAARNTLEARIQNALRMGDNLCSEADATAMGIESQAGPSTRHLLYGLITPETVYLEVGLRLGGSFCAALMGHPFKAAFGIELPNVGGMAGFKDQLTKNTSRITGPFALHFEDCWQFDPALITEPVTVYLFDGPHTEEDHCRALTHYQSCLARDFILVVDDWNWPDVKNGTLRGLRACGMRVLYQAERCGQDYMLGRYYNGLFVAHVRKP